ncbi:MAG: hypothetical protein M1823_000748 [Watsoniomyces obsoletus]|nr:MAG: hypothetical protein M1823_000748 [Watsoniomyces obsoletus]
MINPESFAHHFRKLQADGAFRNASETTQATSLNLPPPPAYTPSANMPPLASNTLWNEAENEYDDDDDDDAEAGSGTNTTTIEVAAPIKIVGHGNILNTSSLAQSMSTALTAALKQHEQQPQSTEEASDDNTVAADVQREAAKKTTPPRSLRININCSVSIVGSRNVVGDSVAKAALAARMAAISAAAAGASVSSSAVGTSVGVKRSAEEEVPDESAPPAKKLNTNE